MAHKWFCCLKGDGKDPFNFHFELRLNSWLPDVSFSYQKSQFGYIWNGKCLYVYFMTI
jgi:hypothetical protein